jgi:uncharacterized membrane protein YgcG
LLFGAAAAAAMRFSPPSSACTDRIRRHAEGSLEGVLVRRAIVDGIATISNRDGRRSGASRGGVAQQGSNGTSSGGGGVKA